MIGNVTSIGGVIMEKKKLQTSPVIVKTYYVFIHHDGTADDPEFKRCAYVF